MPPRENQNYTPAVNRAPINRAPGSIDGVTPRSFQSSPLPNRPPVRLQPYSSPAEPVQQQAVVSQPPAAPVVAAVQLPAQTDEVPLALAGPTPTAAAAGPAVQPLTFTPPPVVTAEGAKPQKQRLKQLASGARVIGRRLRRRRVLIPTAIVAVVALAGFGVYTGIQYLQTQASPDTIYKDALANALMTNQVQVNQQSDSGQATTLLDLTSLKSPRISSQQTAMIAGATFGFATYGTAKDSFMEYTSLPTGLSTTTAAAVTNRWVKLRQAGQLPAAINMTISNAADPRYQALGPLLFAHLDAKTSQIIASFLVDHKVYGYSLTKVQKVNMNGTKALVYSGSFNADYSKIADQSVATSEGFSIADVQRVVSSLTPFKGGNSSLYIDPGKRLPLKLVLTTKDGQTVSYDYSKFNAVQLPAQPASSIDWPQFAATQLLIESQVSGMQTAAQRDTMRQNDLVAIQTALAQYYSTNGFYPSLANLNNQTWLATNLPTFDPDFARDPQASTMALLASAPLATPASTNKTAPKPVVAATPIFGYIYQPITAQGKICANETTTTPDQRCMTYSLTATLSNGKPYSVKSPQ